MREKLELVTKDTRDFGKKISIVGMVVILLSLIFFLLTAKNSESILKELLLAIETAEKEISEPWLKKAKEITIYLLEYENHQRETISADIKTFAGIVFSAIENQRRMKEILKEYEMLLQKIEKSLKAEEKTSAFFSLADSFCF